MALDTLKADEAYAIHRQNAEVLRQCRNTVRRMIDHQIREHSKKHQLSLEFMVPKYVFGEPLYNYEWMMDALSRSLKRDKYDVRRSDIVTLEISWERTATRRKRRAREKGQPDAMQRLRQMRQQIEVNKALGYS